MDEFEFKANEDGGKVVIAIEDFENLIELTISAERAALLCSMIMKPVEQIRLRAAHQAEDQAR